MKKALPRFRPVLSRLLLLSALLALGPSSRAGTPDERGEALLGALEEARAIAHEHRLDVEESPEFTIVLRGGELRTAGVKDLFEALGLVPGIQTSVMQNGIKKVVMRGYDNPNSFVFDKFRLIVDGHTVNTVSFQNTSYYLNFPMELIDRIEVILGPAAAMETSGALTGVIRLFTLTGTKKEEGGALFFRGGSWHEAMAGVRQNHGLGDDLVLGLDAYYRRHDRRVEADGYQFRDTLEGVRDPESVEWLEDTSLGASIASGTLKLSGRVKEERHGNYFGWEERLERATDTGMTGRHAYLQALFDTEVSASERLALQLDYSHFRYVAELQNYYMDPSGSPVYVVPARIVQSESSWQFDGSLRTTRLAGHRITAGWRGVATKQIANGFEVEPPLEADTTLTEPDRKRYVSSFYLLDVVEFGEKTDGHFALRYDRLSDMHDGYFSAEATLRYRLDERVQCKLGYGHAYRAPSWVERYTIGFPGLRKGNPDLSAEEADTLEASLLMTPTLAHKLVVNLYYTNVDNLIDNREVPPALKSRAAEYDNYANRESRGFELVYRFHPSAVHDLSFNLAYCDAEYVTETGHRQAMPGVAHWSGNLLYTHAPSAATTLSARLRYVGPKVAHRDYAADAPGASLTLDATASYRASDGWKLYLSVRNLFDEKVYDSSYYGRHDGIPRPGRNMYVSVEYPL